MPSTISSHCCSIPFTLNGNVHYSCTDDGFGVGCFSGDREWKLCRQPAGEFPWQSIFSEHELTFTFAIGLVVVNLSVVSLSVRFVRRTRLLEIFDNVCRPMPFGTPDIS